MPRETIEGPGIQEVTKMRQKKIRINIGDRQGNKQHVMEIRKFSIREKLLRLLFGDIRNVMVITPDRSVEGIEISVERGGKNDGSN